LYTHRFLLEIGANGHRSLISCEIAIAGKYELIIPFRWWHDEHPLDNIGNLKKLVFEDTKCEADGEDEAVANRFKKDKTVAYDEEVQYVGKMECEEEGGI